jgi:hypothetical protein
MTVRSVARLLDFIHFLLNTREFTLVRNPTNVRNARKPLDSTHTLLSIRRFIMEFNTQKSSHVHYVVKRQEIHF